MTGVGTDFETEITQNYRSARRVAVQDGNMIGVRLSSSNHLYLTETEANRLVEIVRQQLICRATDQADEPVIIADTPMSVAEAWELIDRLDTSNGETVDWSTEGF
jgi:biopolymer transport protein ExbD